MIFLLSVETDLTHLSYRDRPHWNAPEWLSPTLPSLNCYSSLREMSHVPYDLLISSVVRDHTRVRPFSCRPPSWSQVLCKGVSLWSPLSFSVNLELHWLDWLFPGNLFPDHAVLNILTMDHLMLNSPKSDQDWRNQSVLDFHSHLFECLFSCLDTCRDPPSDTQWGIAGFKVCHQPSLLKDEGF